MPWTWYTRQLATRPCTSAATLLRASVRRHTDCTSQRIRSDLTRSIVAATMMGSGDAIAQQLFERREVGKRHDVCPGRSSLEEGDVQLADVRSLTACPSLATARKDRSLRDLW